MTGGPTATGGPTRAELARAISVRPFDDVARGELASVMSPAQIDPPRPRLVAVDGERVERP